MTTPPSTPGRASRAALIARLVELRAAAGLSGNALAKRMGVVQSRVWKIEHDKLMPGEDDIKAWVEATGAGGETAAALTEMLAEARTEQAFGTVFRSKGGPAAYQERVMAIEARSARIGEFQVAVIPGILQTADYAREVVSLPAGLRTWGADDAGIEAFINARLRRQEILYDQAKRVQVVLSEGALRTLVVAPEVLAAQLDKLLAVSRLPSVELGVISFGQRVPAYTLGGFRVYDEGLIVVEAIDEERYLSREEKPGEVGAFLEAFDALMAEAVTGDEARRLITAAAADLREAQA